MPRAPDDRGSVGRTAGRWLAWPVAIGGLAAVVAAAASLALTADSLGAAVTAVPRCTTAGLGVTQNLSGSTVATVTVAGLPAACGGATLLVTASNGTSSGSASTTVPAGGGSVLVTLGTAPAAATADQIDVLVIGP